jgi:hypothetical protein
MFWYFNGIDLYTDSNGSYRNVDTWGLLRNELDEKRTYFQKDRIILMSAFNG